MKWPASKKFARIVMLFLLLAAVAVAAVVMGGYERTKSRLTEVVIRRVLASAIGKLPPAQNDAQEVRTMMLTMRDGVQLETHVYLPAGKGPWPAILVRDPYSLTKYVTCDIFVHYGYACVHQDVRGRYGSQGAWYPLINERNDGIDTLKWLLAQPWQNESIGMWGSSYLGLSEWAVADEFPPEVKTFVSGISHGDLYEMIYHNGEFRQGVAGVFSSTLFQPLEKQIDKRAQRYWRDTITHTWPATSADREAFGPAWTSYHDYLMHPEKSDPYWQSPAYAAIRDSYKSIQVPVMITERWYDFFLPGTLKTFESLPTRGQSRMVVEPGDHAANPGDLKVTAKNEHRSWDTLAWFDHFLKGTPLPDSLRPGYTIYVNGADRWEDLSSWPPKTQPLTLNLHDLRASHRCGGGGLAPQAASDEQPVSYVYDPRNPVPTRGGSDMVVDGLAPSSSAEQKTDLCSRPDVLSFASASFEKASLVSGSIKVRLQVSSNAPDTAFALKLSEQFADGRVLLIRDDISTLSLRNGAALRLTYAPNDQVEVDFDLAAIAWQIQPGSRLRLEITSSDFPAFNAHPNKAGLWSEVATPAVATQTIYGGGLDIPVSY